MSETNDNRYVQIATKVKQHCDGIREELFQEIENESWQCALNIMDTLKRYDGIYMLALKKGMEVVAANRTPEERAKIEEIRKGIEAEQNAAMEAAAKADAEKLKAAKAVIAA
jgi:hypothetical protein